LDDCTTNRVTLRVTVGKKISIAWLRCAWISRNECTSNFLFLLLYQIIGLTPPPLGHKALANKFIDKALEFKPKLLILIVDPEIER